MYIIKNNTVIPVPLKEVVQFGTCQDPRILKVETVVANYFKTTVHELNVFYKDTEAKVMCCFLLHDIFSYSIGSVAARYNIDRFYLQNQITRKYITCLQDNKALNEVLQMREAYQTIELQQPVTN